MLINIISKLLQKLYQIKHDYYVCNDMITIISNTLYHIVNNKYVYLLYFSFLLELILLKIIMNGFHLIVLIVNHQLKLMLIISLYHIQMMKNIVN